MLQTCANVGTARFEALRRESVACRGLPSVSYCYYGRYTRGVPKWLQFSQVLGNITFCRTSSFHRNFHSVSRSRHAGFVRDLASSAAKILRLIRANSKVTPRSTARPLNRSWTAQNSCREEKKSGEQRENAVHRDTNDAERQRDEPNDGEQHNRQQSQRPADDKQDAPEEKCGHVRSPDTSYARDARKVSLGPVAY